MYLYIYCTYLYLLTYKPITLGFFQKLIPRKLEMVFPFSVNFRRKNDSQKLSSPPGRVVCKLRLYVFRTKRAFSEFFGAQFSAFSELIPGNEFFGAYLIGLLCMLGDIGNLSWAL